jgi:mono/diheme cytochrome c family protein
MTGAHNLAVAAGLLGLATLGFAASAQERQRTPEQIYVASCAHCHGAGGWGTRTLLQRVPADEAELLRRKALPAALTALVVRRGIGAMPPLTPTDATDEELARLARWLDERN